MWRRREEGGGWKGQSRKWNVQAIVFVDKDGVVFPFLFFFPPFVGNVRGEGGKRGVAEGCMGCKAFIKYIYNGRFFCPWKEIIIRMG